MTGTTGGTRGSAAGEGGDLALVRLGPPPPRRRLLAGPIPFGLGITKPHHLLSMIRIAWQNRSELGHAFRVLTRGTCDGCALGTIGVRDWTLRPWQVHLCTVRLELLRLNTMGPIRDFEGLLADPGELDRLTSTQLRDLGRLPYPMRRRAGERGFARVAWEDFFAEAGARIASLSHPDRFALFTTSRGVTNETYYVAGKLARLLGTNNVDNSARLCHSPSTAAMKDTVGVAATTCSYRDWYEADLVVFFGSNPANDQPVSIKYLHEARRRGTRVVTVNTYREPGMDRYWVPSTPESAVFGTRVSDDFFLVHTGGDLAFLDATLKVLLEAGAVDRDFVSAHVEGFEAFEAAIRGMPMEGLLALSGASRDDVEAFAAILASARRGVLVWSMGITQHAHGSDTVRAIADLALIRGWVGRPGTGLMPIRGHSGVQGGAEMGAYATAFPGGIGVTPESASALSSQWGFPVPGRPGLATTAMIDAALAGELDVFHVVGGNFLETLPQPARVEAALARVPVRIHQDIVLTKQMWVPARETTWILPARTRYEQRGGGTETTTERRVVLSPEIPGHDVGEAMTEWEILMRLGFAARSDLRDRIHFEDGAAIRAEIARVIPDYAPIADLRAPGDQFQWGGPHLCPGGRFPLPGGKARLRPVAPPELSLGEGELRLSTRRGKQFNSMVQGEVDPLTGARRADVLISPQDAARHGLGDGDPVLLRSAHGEFRGRARLAPIRPGNVQGHWPEVNVLLPPDRVDPGGGVPDYNAVVRLERG